jgi:hypothetical protein
MAQGPCRGSVTIYEAPGEASAKGLANGSSLDEETDPKKT